MSNNPNQYPTAAPAQEQQHQPGEQQVMHPEPEIIKSTHLGSHKLKDKVVLISGGDSGIGRSVAVLFAREGADVAIIYLEEQQDAEKTKQLVEQEGQHCLLLKEDISDPKSSEKCVAETLKVFGKINILINNAGVQYQQKDLGDISTEQLEKTFKTNIFSMFHLTKAVLPHLKEGDSIINTTSITSYHGHDELMDYASTKGAITTFTRSLSNNLMKQKKGIRVNGVAPGPIWTPLIPSSFDAETVAKFGQDTPMGRMGQPSEVAPAYLFLASDDASYITGQVIHVNGGEIVNG
ncbi:MULTISPECIES: SDR family oxidoreductase [Acinetobacter]|uniref:SDR family oxidoreductase n=1 Tax=Acinetobacter TaxID=469 RepID=UPI00029E8D58|nr:MULTISPECIES: SDR family oxidoreductase [Acinetobacter]EKU51394.1 KR domain protein [Acinetobacter sp. WC-323]EXB47463.1 oxidoreductase, short chain dehydrogenase/reductase family [Acinetobacter baumannii 146457]EYT24146.1 oxidoreductase, short chain dehydrogenase/reductase family [Acinetobacter sp. 1000160]MCU4576937.1 SDR family oxidoreductase [Acinetobacter courvalinii]